MAQRVPGKIYEQLGSSALATDGIRPGGRKLTERAVTLSGFTSGSRVLDVGCGNGATLTYLQEDLGATAVGVDPSVKLLDQARGRHICLSLILGTGAALPFSEESFDGVILECTLSLIEDPLTVLRECYRILKPGGRIVVSDVYSQNQSVGAELEILPKDCCLRGARSRDHVLGTLSGVGFDVDFWEDRSEFLREFAVKLVWSYGSIFDFLGLRNDQLPERETTSAVIRECRPGYFLLVGTKKGDQDLKAAWSPFKGSERA